MTPTNKLPKKNILLKNEEIKKSKGIVSKDETLKNFGDLTSPDDKCSYIMNIVNQQGEKIKKLEKKVEYIYTDYLDDGPCFIL